MAVEDEQFAIQREFISYIHPSKSITDDAEEKACWITQMKYLVKDYKFLLSLPFKKFWSTIVFNNEATIGLNSFLQEAAPPHLIDQLPQDTDIFEIYNKIDHYAFLVFKRLTKPVENLNNQMSSYYMWNLLCDKNIIDIPMLFDICSIYGKSKKKELEKLFIELFSSHPLYTEHLKTSIQTTIDCLCQFQEKIQYDLGFRHDDGKPRKIDTISAEIDKDILPVIEDIILFLLDTACSISNFLEIYPMANFIFYQEKLHMQIAVFYHNVKPLIYRKLYDLKKLDEFQEKLHIARVLLVGIVQQCLKHLTNDVMTKKKAVNPIEEYLEIITELLNYSEFVADYNVLFNLTKDIKRCQKIHKHIDFARFDYLLKSIELMSVSNKELKQTELENQQIEQQISNISIENATLQSHISKVKELLPHLGDGFVQKCLEYYNMDSEKVINIIFENNLPPELSQYDYNLPAPSQHDIDTYEENATGYDPSYKGGKKLQKLKAVLDDKSFRNEMRSFYDRFNYTEVTCAELETYYDDEYDDTYDSIDFMVPEPLDENDKRRPDVVPRVLTEKKTVKKETFDDDVLPSHPVVNFQPFCENPEVVRERQARKYAAKQFNRGNQSSQPKASPSSSTTPGPSRLEKQRKNENKELHGNHNRRNAARSKQQKGMF